MSLAPLDIKPIIVRVRGEVPGFRTVQGAAEFAAAVESQTPVTPSAFVLLAREDGQPRIGGSGRAVQPCRSRFSVVSAVRNYQQSQLGTAQSDELRTLLIAQRGALIGWQHTDYAPSEATTVSFVSGALLRYDAATVWWQEIYELTHFLTN